jgi:transcriptional regulator with XRE-family HTH domain
MSFDSALITLGNNIRKVRKQKKITLQQLAFLSKIEYRQLGRIERAEVNTTIVSLIRIAIALDSNFNDFFINVLDAAKSEYNEDF